MKKRLIPIMGALIIGTAPAHAGIPVVDGAHIGQSIAAQVETIGQWMQQLNQMSQQYQQLVQMYQKADQTFKALQGASNFGQVLNALPMNQISPDLAKLITDVKGLANFDLERGRFPTFPDAPKLNKMYDTIAGQRTVFRNMYDSTNHRIKNIENLMGRINSAKDPGDKLDLANRLSIEQATVQANIQAMEAYREVSRAEIETAGNEARREWACMQFGKRGC